jgi:signal transduction histidine kinase
MKYEILLLTVQKDQTDDILSSALMSSFLLEKITVKNDLNPEIFLSSMPRHPDCILVNSAALQIVEGSFSQTLSTINQTIPVIVLLPFADPELLQILLNNRLFHYIILPLSINNLRVRIEEIISIHLKNISIKDSFFTHPYFTEFRHELLNPLTIAAGYIDLLSSSLSDENSPVYCEKITESIKKIQSLLSIIN